MPELSDPKPRPHPWNTIASPAEPAGRPLAFHAYAELAVTSNFTFLTGASHPDELVDQAAALGYRAVAITDTNTLAGVVRAHVAAKDAGLPLVIGCRLSFAQPHGLSVLVYPTDRPSYGRLCRLLTVGKRRAPKGECHLAVHDLIEHHAGLLAVVVPPRILDQNFLEVMDGLKRHFTGDRLSLACSLLHGPNDGSRFAQLVALSEHTGIPLAAVNDVHYHHPARRPLQDVLTCIRHGCTIDQAGLRLFANAERCLKPPHIMARLFEHCPHAIARSVQIAERAVLFSLDQLRYQYPEEVVPIGSTPMQHLIDLTWKGAADRYLRGIPAKVRSQIEHEFRLIDELKYAPYFLTVRDLVTFARSQDILCQGRGAAANSAVCYCLGVTAVDPDRIDMLFERFVSKERDEPPDIDIDFEHERREEVIQYIYRKYGRERAALTAEVVSYRGRSAVRDVGKALGLSLDCVDRLAKNVDWWHDAATNPERLRELGLNPDDRTIRLLKHLTGEIRGFPRHLSQHVGGFVITRDPLCETVPIENAAMDDRTVIEWDKDDVDAMGMLKVDVLGLGMLTCIRKAITLINEHRPSMGGTGVPPVQSIAPAERLCHPCDGTPEESSGGSRGRFEVRRNLVLASLYDPHDRPSEVEHHHSVIPAQAGIQLSPPRTLDLQGQLDNPLDSRLRGNDEGCRQSSVQETGALHDYPLQLHTIPPEDSAVYDMICHADTIGVFQIESRAQMSMLPRLRPRRFYDLVIEVAIVRPGPIQGDMVHPYLRRRNGREPISYPSEDVRRVLAKTLGVPLFQEQAMSLAIVAAGFTPGEADQLRRAIAAWKSRNNKIAAFGERLISGMTARGYEKSFAQRCFEQIKGFSGYGFPESHAASFALLVYASSWIKCYYPAVFAAALLNSQPMGFYAPAQIVRDASEHGVTVKPVDVNHSQWDCTLEDDGNSLRLGMRLVKQLSKPAAEAITGAVKSHGRCSSLQSLQRISGVRVAVLRSLAAADAFGSMGLDRQSALWQIRAMNDEPLPILNHALTESNESTGHSYLPEVPPLRTIIHDYASTGLTLRAHPVSFIRSALAAKGAVPNAQLQDAGQWRPGRRITVAGIVLVRQRPSTANGIVFMTLEDESGIANLIIRPQVYQRDRTAARHGVIVLAQGTVERQGQVVHVLVNHLESVTLSEVDPLGARSRDFH